MNRDQLNAARERVMKIAWEIESEANDLREHTPIDFEALESLHTQYRQWNRVEQVINAMLGATPQP